MFGNQHLKPLIPDPPRAGVPWAGVHSVFFKHSPRLQQVMNFPGSGDIRSGHKGFVVCMIQAALTVAGSAKLVADGMFGPKTAEAVRRFQARHSIPETGVVNARTLLTLDAGVRRVTDTML